MKPAATWLTRPLSTSIHRETSTRKMFITSEYSLVGKHLHRHQRRLRHRLQHQHRRLHLQLHRHLPSLRRPQRHQAQRLQLPLRLPLRLERHRGRDQLLILVRRRGDQGIAGTSRCDRVADSFRRFFCQRIGARVLSLCGPLRAGQHVPPAPKVDRLLRRRWEMSRRRRKYQAAKPRLSPTR
jgi:hypothetical protein